MQKNHTCNMKFTRFILSALLTFVISAAMAQPLYVATYNIRYENNDDTRKGNGWSQRCPVVCAQINFEHPDIFGAQEVLHHQLIDMLQTLDHYEFIGCGRDDGKEAGEYAPIFYDPQKIRLLQQGHFWISQNPEKPGIGWDAACPRICTWGRFQLIDSGVQFFFFNLHLDHMGRTARDEGAKLVMKVIKELATDDLPVILTGDFNGDQYENVYRFFNSSDFFSDCYEACRIRFAENGTFNNYKQEAKNESRIDHIFVSPHISVDRYAILTNAYWSAKQDGDKPQRRLPSDHYPVFVHLNIK